MRFQDPQEIVEAVRKAGVVGAGGGGFPTHVKLSAKVDTVIANGSECEPLLATDKSIMVAGPHLVVQGLGIAMKAVGASKGIVAVKGHYKDVVAALKTSLPEDGSITLHMMDNYYPAGDEFLLVYDVTGRVIPEGGIPLNVGVVVSNVVSLVQIARAIDGVPVTSRTLTVTGEVRTPIVINAPIGTPYRELVNMAGGFTAADAALIDGGPMMGKLVDDLDAGIAKTTSGLLALPREHFIVRTKLRTVEQEMKLSRSACCQCFRCTDVCPRNLLGHQLYPHMTMRTVNYRMTEPTEHVTSAFLCSQCGMCEMVGCDFMRLSPKRVYAHIRQRLASAGVANPHKRSGLSAREPYPFRKFPIPALLKKIGVERYDGKPTNAGEAKVSGVRIALNRHTGAPATPVVKAGDSVRLGDPIGEIPEGKLGARYHASIAGKVTSVADGCVEITV